MFLIDKYKNRIDKIEQKTFSGLRFKEQEHLEEWYSIRAVADFKAITCPLPQ